MKTLWICDFGEFYVVLTSPTLTEQCVMPFNQDENADRCFKISMLKTMIIAISIKLRIDGDGQYDVAVVVKEQEKKIKNEQE